MNGESLIPPRFMMKMSVWRYPFFLVDRITDLKRADDGSISGIKNVSFNEPYIPGHFVDFPILPGVLIAEALGQLSAYYVLMSEYCSLFEALHQTELVTAGSIRNAFSNAQAGELIDQVRARYGLGVLASQNLRFKGMVLPGDTLVLKSQLSVRSLYEETGFYNFKVEASVDDQIVCTGRLSNYRIGNKLVGRNEMHL